MKYKKTSGVPMAVAIEKAVVAYLNLGTVTDKLTPVVVAGGPIDCGQDNA